MSKIKLREMESLNLTANLSEEWMYLAIRHCQRNEEFDLDEEDAQLPARQEGTDMAKALNAFPALLSWVRRAAPHLREIDRLRDNEIGLFEEPMTDEHAEIKALLAEIEDEES